MNLLSVIFGLIVCFVVVESHSWVHCVDYDSSASLLAGQLSNPSCKAWARGIPNTAVFGEDRGFNYQPVNNIACRDSYTATAPMNRFVPGQTIRLVWPAKNHVAAPCTNPYISSGTLRLYAVAANRPTAPDLPWTTWRSDSYLVHDFDTPPGKGFQHCPDFCPTTDRVPCYGDVPLPRNLSQGWVKFLWVWNFNPNEWYTTCFDAFIGDGASSPVPSTRAPSSPVPTTRAPSSPVPSTRAPSSPVPTTRAPSVTRAPTRSGTGCAAEWAQCGGQGYSGPRCCVPGTRCQTQNRWYAQCLK